MSITTFLIIELFQSGLWDSEARQVVEEMQKEMPEMSGKWEEDIDHYPPQMKAVLWLSAKEYAVKWIDGNKPQHFARAILSQ